MGIAHGEVVPLCVSARAVVPVEQQIVIVTVYMNSAAQIPALETRLEEQRIARHPVDGAGRKHHRVVNDAIDYLTSVGEFPSTLLRGAYQFLLYCTGCEGQRLDWGRWWQC